MHKIHVEADFPVTDNQREHARHINGLETATAEYEAAIKKVTGQDVKIRIYVRRHKEVADGPIAQAVTLAPEPVSAVAAMDPVAESVVAITHPRRHAGA